MDHIECKGCGEDWDKEHMRHDEIWETELSKVVKRIWDGQLTEEILAEFEKIGWVFENNSVFQIRNCPICPPEARTKRKSAMEIIRDIMED